MGEKKVTLVNNKNEMSIFVQKLLNDLQALEMMLDKGRFETGVVRIGAEQEMAIVNRDTWKPAPINMEIFESMKDCPWLDTELARFNLEVNLNPRLFTGTALSDMEKENISYLTKIAAALEPHNAKILLTGILPTLRKYDLDLKNLTPIDRYRALIEGINNQREGNAFELRFNGIDELFIRHDSPLLEACNTSFQVHLQVSPDDFVDQYNISQLLVAPVMALAANSPLVFGRRLWHESRIALFQQALDTRTTHEHMRERQPRVSFGTDWLNSSILEIYQEDIARFRVLLAAENLEDAVDMVKKGKTPKLKSLQVHNSTVYRWNRPCYGISENGKPHLRIENRVLPAGPTVIDEMANAAFWLGAMVGIHDEYGDITDHVSFEDVRDNFVKAAKFGVDSTFNWLGAKEKMSACDVVLKELLPLAEAGLKKQKIDPKDINRYLSVIEGRATKHMTGARWILKSFTDMKAHTTRDEAAVALTHAISINQEKEIPVHEWPLPGEDNYKAYRPDQMKVDEFMETDLFTVRQDDLIDLVAQLMDWREVRYMPVEDEKGHLVGLISSRLLLRHFSKASIAGTREGLPLLVEEIMEKNPTTIEPAASITEAIRKMRDNEIGCLPVVNGQELIGVITEMDFLRITGRMLLKLEANNADNYMMNPKARKEKARLRKNTAKKK